MKKLSLILSVIMIMLLVCSCGSEKEKAPDNSAKAIKPFDVVIDPDEYVLYQNIFYNEAYDEYVGKEQTKTGIFSIVYDRYSEVERYYVWGYYDQTKCCDWQWEICPDGLTELPKEGSKIEVKGTFAGSDKALDKYWLEGAYVTVVSEYTGTLYDVNMCLMSATLERVQLANMQQHKEFFEGKSLSSYGRILNLDNIQHPYYDSSWIQPFSTPDGSAPAIGTTVTVVGNYVDGVIDNAEILATSAY